MKIGYYSEGQRRYGSFFWSKPDGSEVEITEVRDDGSSSQWIDAECVGEVVDFVRAGAASLTELQSYNF